MSEADVALGDANANTSPQKKTRRLTSVPIVIAMGTREPRAVAGPPYSVVL